jgi:hypothetical protein
MKQYLKRLEQDADCSANTMESDSLSCGEGQERGTNGVTRKAENRVGRNILKHTVS